MTEPAELKIHEETTNEGLLSPVFLRVEGDRVSIVNESGSFTLPDAALFAVMSRFGAPFDDSASVSVVAGLELPAGCSLRHVRHLAGYDVIARDYLVYECPELEPLCALSTAVTAALVHLGRAAQKHLQPKTPKRLPEE